MRLPVLLPAALIASAVFTAARPAEAKGTFFLVELSTGLGESAYAAGAPGLTYGLSAGTTFKLKFLPVRWYVLANASNRNAAVAGIHEGISYSVDRKDLDLYLSVRTVIPVWGPVRLYGEAGAGNRFLTQTIRRSGDLGSISESSSSLLLVLALGMQARLTETISVGLRGELTPLVPRADLATFAADLSPTPNRLSLLAQIGVHF